MKLRNLLAGALVVGLGVAAGPAAGDRFDHGLGIESATPASIGTFWYRPCPTEPVHRWRPYGTSAQRDPVFRLPPRPPHCWEPPFLYRPL